MPALAKKLRLLVLAATTLAAMLVPGGPSTAGTSVDPEITDAAGDAHFINGQGLSPGLESGPDVRPASSDSLDLLAVWFETSYRTNRILDPSGGVLRVEHVPEQLLVHIRTQAPVRPGPSVGPAYYKIRASLPTCRAIFQLRVSGTSAPTGAFRAVDACPPLAAGAAWLSTENQPLSDPILEGNVATLRFPLYATKLAQTLADGSSVSQPAAWAVIAGDVSRTGPTGNETLISDEAAPGRAFTIGQDVPTDVDCSATPQDPACQA